MIRNVPNIERQPRTVADTATHYGYCAFKDINLAGPVGLEYKVQPADSPYYLKLPARELIPFTNIEFSIIDELAGGNHGHTGPNVRWKTYNKSARVCADEMADAYASWGFLVLTPLTGFSTVDAFAVFQTIQPFTYKLADLEGQLDAAIDRIEATEPYEVSYDGETVTLQPLREDLKAVAEEVRAIMAQSASTALDKATEIVENTRLSMTSAFSGGPGKRRPDPNDKYLYNELNEQIPTLLDSEKKKDNGVGELVQVLKGNNASSDELKRKELELREREIALREKEIELRIKEANREKMAAVRASKQPN